MNISISQQNNTELQQTQQLSAVQLQKLDILQSNCQQLQQRIAQELIQNPILEADLQNANEVSLADYGNGGSISDDAIASLAEYDEQFAKDFVMAQASKTDDGSRLCDEFIQDICHRNQDIDEEEKRRHALDSITGNDGPLQALFNEIDYTAGENTKLAEIARELVGHLDENGFLPNEGKLVLDTGHSRQEIIDAIALLQDMDPPGIGAKDLKECLLIQLKRERLQGSIEWDIIASHFDDLANHQITKIATALDLDLEEINAAIDRIKALDPHPGAKLFDNPVPIIVPDIIIQRDDQDNWKIKSNRSALPAITLNQDYLDMLNDDSTDGETRKYLREKQNSAQLLINSIEQRWTTLERISAELLKRQMDFFTSGDDAIRPMTLADIATALKLNESTISRAISDKYLSTPWGIRTFKHFFRAGIKSASGDEISNLAVINKIKKMIEEEDHHHPISDQDIAKKLQAEGMNIARRTVAKYRDQCGIPSTSQRKLR